MHTSHLAIIATIFGVDATNACCIPVRKRFCFAGGQGHRLIVPCSASSCTHTRLYQDRAHHNCKSAFQPYYTPSHLSKDVHAAPAVQARTMYGVHRSVLPKYSRGICCAFRYTAKSKLTAVIRYVVAWQGNFHWVNTLPYRRASSDALTSCWSISLDCNHCLRPSTLLLSAVLQVQHRLGSTMTLTRTCVQYLAPALIAHGQPQTPSAFWYKLHNKQLQRRPSLSLSAPRLRYKLFSGRRRQVVHYQHCRASHGSGSCWSYARLSYKSVF